MAKIKVEGLSEYLELLEVTEKKARSMIGRSIHPGAKIVARECKRRVDNLETDDTPANKIGPGKLLRRGVTSAQKKGLQLSLGIATMRRYGDELNVKLGFDGYNSVKTKYYPKGQPNMMIARSVENGTSYMMPTHFMELTVKTTEKVCIEEMEKAFDLELEKYWSRHLKEK